ncbi:MAG: DUF6788 family protein [Mycobacterium sp.]
MDTHKKEIVFGELSVRQLRARRRRLVARLPDVHGYLAGSLVEQSRRCGKPGCRCAGGELHGPYVYLSVGRAAGRRSLFYVPEALVALVRRRAALTASVQRLLGDISAINLELLARRELD